MEPYYSRDGVVLYLADCRDVLPGLPRESVDLLLADPPYGAGFQSNWRSTKFAPMAGDSDAAWVPEALTMAGMVLRRSRHAYVFGKHVLEEFPLRYKTDLIWDKMMMGSGDLSSPWGPSHEPIMFAVRAPDRAKANMAGGNTPARLRTGSVLRFPRPNAGQVQRHPTEKPVALLRQLIESSSRHGETVLDPTVGSGSTLVAAVAEGRKAIGIEIDEQFCELSVRRVEAALNAVRDTERALS